jgi:hypothetical protein
MKEIAELNLGPVESTDDIQLAIREIVDKINELIRALQEEEDG